MEARRVGFARAEAAVRALAGTVEVEEPNADAVVAASRWKARGGLSYADAFAAATAERHSAPLLTGDPELVALGGQGLLDVVDLRAG